MTFVVKFLLFNVSPLFSKGVRRLGAAAVDMCHVALGIVEAYWEYRLKPWDMAAGVLVIIYLLSMACLFTMFASFDMNLVFICFP